MADTILIEASELASLVGSDRVFILDATYSAAYSLQSNFQNRIPGARFFNLKEIRDTSSSHPTALPSLEHFKEAMIQLGIKNDGTLVVVYDTLGVVTAPRAWWMLKYYGYSNVKLLNGGLPKWVEEGRATESGEYTIESRGDINEDDYKFTANNDMKARFEDVEECVRDLSEGKSCKMLWECRPGEACASSLIPNSKIVPVRDMYYPDKTIKSDGEIKKIFEEAEFDINLPVITTCMLGVAASNGYFVMKYLGKRDVKLYAGSFTEWKTSKAL
jgi:thiosulfate/3-mercaptopyruvate sulfurtransferase